MRWIATLVATCLVALCALHPVTRVQPRHATSRASIDDTSDIVAKLVARRTTAPAPDKRDERLGDVALAATPVVPAPPRVTLAFTHAPMRAPAGTSQLSPTARGPPRLGSPGIVSIS